MGGIMEDEKDIVTGQENEVVASADQELETVHTEEGAPADEQADAVEDHEHKGPDYSTFTKNDFASLVKELAQDNDLRKVDMIVREIKPLFDELRNTEREEALKTFTASGGIAEDFEYRQDESDITFDTNLKVIRDKRVQHFKSLEDQKADNLLKKNELLEKLRGLVDGEDSAQSFNQFKELQKIWKGLGPVPNTQVKTLWANYTALVDRFYDNRSIYFELKELDRKKNLEAKIELCVRAEKLFEVEKLKDAVRELNELHNEFKHIGPVPKEEKESSWQRFKAASDAIYKKRDAFLDTLGKEQSKNQEEKLKVAEEVAAFANFQTDRIKEWNQKTQEILALQKKWEGIGGVARTNAKEVNRKFWSAFKAFFSKKSSFFKKLDEERDHNLKAKQEIIQSAHELKESTDWEKTANALKDLQRRWKEVGPVPEKQREKVFQEFKDACDFFFEQRRGQFEKLDNEQDVNLQQKDAICKELEDLAATKTGTLDQFHALVDRYNALGFVPRKAINDSKNRFQKAVDQFFKLTDGISPGEKDRVMMGIQVENLKNDPQAERKIYQKEISIRKRITSLENDIATLRNNLEFFGRSKNAEAFKAEFNGKIDEATTELKALKDQLKLLRTV